MTSPFAAFSCAHAGYTAAVHHPVHGYIGTGNVSSDSQYSTYLRADAPTIGWPAFQNRLPKAVYRSMRAVFDAQAPAHNDTLIGYIVHHRPQGARQSTIHGAFLTTPDHRLLWKAHTGPTWKSGDAVDKVIAHILPRFSAHQTLAALAA